MSIVNINKSLDEIQSLTLSDMLTKVWLEVVFVNEELSTISMSNQIEIIPLNIENFDDINKKRRRNYVDHD